MMSAGGDRGSIKSPASEGRTAQRTAVHTTGRMTHLRKRQPERARRRALPAARGGRRRAQLDARRGDAAELRRRPRRHREAARAERPRVTEDGRAVVLVHVLEHPRSVRRNGIVSHGLLRGDITHELDGIGTHNSKCEE